MKIIWSDESKFNLIKINERTYIRQLVSEEFRDELVYIQRKYFKIAVTLMKKVYN